LKSKWKLFEIFNHKICSIVFTFKGQVNLRFLTFDLLDRLDDGI